jgi:hypothetical protein
MKRNIQWVGIIIFQVLSVAAKPPDKPIPVSLPQGLCELGIFGPVGTSGEIKATFQKAVEAMNKSGGVLCLNQTESALLKPENSYQRTFRIPERPAPAKEWGTATGFTIIEVGAKKTSIDVPQQSGLQINRTLRMDADDSLTHWTTDFPVNISNRIIAGSNSYLDALLEPVAKGNNARFYVATIRGIRPGQFLNAHTGPGYDGAVDRLYVKSVGYDPAKKLGYFVADAAVDHVPKAWIHNKNNVGALRIEQTCNSDEQSYDIMLKRKQYAGGDTYMYFAWFEYMSDIHSSVGDENGTLYGAYVKSMANNFTAKVNTMDWAENKVTFTGDKNVDTLSNSRPLINCNTNKWVTRGKVYVVPAESYWDTKDKGKYPFQGKTYPTTIGTGGLSMGGLIRGDKACRWDASLVGRFFAVTEASERVPDADKPYRWYEITGVTENADGTQDLIIRRYWWGAKNAGSPTLYLLENGTWDGHERPLSYAIAPGTYVNDVSKAIPSPGFTTVPVLGLAPYGEVGKPMDFAQGDAVEQAIGPDPFRPIPYRVWLWDKVPGAFPAPVMDVNNSGVQRYAAIVARGGVANFDNLAKSIDGRAPWENVLVLDSASEVGINFKADTTSAALYFQQPYHEQPIKWSYTPDTNKSAREAALTVSRETGDMKFTGGARFGGSVGAAGLSADVQPARNLRGKNVPVKEGATSASIVFSFEEIDASYAVFVEQNWIANRAVTRKDPRGFTVQFEKPAPDGARLDWMIVR